MNCLFSLHRDEAEMEYLKIAQDLEMYGVNYFQIKVSNSGVCQGKFAHAWRGTSQVSVSPDLV